MKKPVIKVNVVSDVVCPWCYIGKRRLEKAMEKLSDKYDFDVEYLPFELNPQMPASGVNQKEYLSKKFGGEARYRQLTGHTTSVAASEGLAFDFDRQEISPNTRNAHRLIQLAKTKGKQLPLVEALFKAYFSEGLNLADINTLVALAKACGMDEQEVKSYLQTEKGLAEVEMTEQQLQQLGITGVPFYIIDNRYGISGAQPSEEFIKVFEEIIPTDVLASGGEACDIDQQNC